MNSIGVHLGRFAPYHRGHEKLTRMIIDKHGMAHTLVLIGSSNRFRADTPYTFAARVDMIRATFPDIQILPLPDSPCSTVKDTYTEAGMSDWLQSLKDLERSFGLAFTFYSGDTEDIAYLAPLFATEPLTDRHATSNGLSATQARQYLAEKNTEALRDMLPEASFSLAIQAYNNPQYS